MTKDNFTSMEDSNITFHKNLNSFEVSPSKTDLENKQLALEETNEEKKEQQLSANISPEIKDNYEPLTYETYKFFIKFSPYIEKIIMNNINKYILQSPQETQELKAFSKLDSEYKLPSELINYLNIQNLSNYKIYFNCIIWF
jgi:hypothetical protein